MPPSGSRSPAPPAPAQPFETAPQYTRLQYLARATEYLALPISPMPETSSCLGVTFRRRSQEQAERRRELPDRQQRHTPAEQPKPAKERGENSASPSTVTKIAPRKRNSPLTVASYDTEE